MVRHDVEHLTHSKFSEPPAKLPVPLLASQFIIDLLRIDDIVAMHAPGSRLKIRGAINV
jgi:hypothetical protein